MKATLEQTRRAGLSEQLEKGRDPVSPTDLLIGSSDREDHLPWPPTETPPSPTHAPDQPPASRFPASDDKTRPHPPPNFAPFDDPTSLAATDGEMPQPAFLIPSGLINPLPDGTPDMDLFRSFKTDIDPFVIKPSRPAVTWRGNSGTDPRDAGNAATPRLPTDLRSNAS